MAQRSKTRSDKDSESKRDRLLRLELAGITEEGTSRLGRPIDTLTVWRPSVVTFDPGRRSILYDTRRTLWDPPRPELLDRFVALAEASDEGIVTFAQQNGVLGLTSFLEEGVYEEPLDTWRMWILRVRAILAAAAAVYQGEQVRDDDWIQMAAPTAERWTELMRADTTRTPAEKRAVIERNCLQDTLNYCLAETRVRPCFTWWRSEGGITFTNLFGFWGEGSVTLSGALALQLVLACSRAQSIATCSGCLTPYLRQWHSPTGRRNYCKKCGIKAAWRDSKRLKRGTK
jgi:hypothetical protein